MDIIGYYWHNIQNRDSVNVSDLHKVGFVANTDIDDSIASDHIDSNINSDERKEDNLRHSQKEQK